jgi:hypothetical protein
MRFAGASMKPSDYPLCSSQSRAAARALLEQRERQYERLEVILGSRERTGNQPRASEWIQNGEEGQLFRTVLIPDGMTLAEGLRAIGGYSHAILDHANASHPEPLRTGSVRMLKR